MTLYTSIYIYVHTYLYLPDGGVPMQNILCTKNKIVARLPATDGTISVISTYFPSHINLTLAAFTFNAMHISAQTSTIVYSRIL